MAQQVLIGNDIAPVVLTGVEHAKQHLREAADHRQRLQRLRRQRRDTKYDHPPRQAGWPAVTVEQVLDKTRMDARPAVAQTFSAHIHQHRAPERRLPAFLVIQRPRAGSRQADMVAPGGPVVEPVGAVNLILVEQVGQPHRQLVTLAAIVVIGEKAFKRGEVGLILQCGQQPHQPPGQRLLVERRLLGHAVAPQNATVAVPEKPRRQLHIQRRGDAAAALRRVGSQRHLQPLGDAVALHQDDFVFQRRQRVRPHPVHRQLAQGLQAVAVDDHQTGGEAVGVLHGSSL